MEEIKEIKITAKKIYKENVIYTGTFLGGPLVAGYLIAENFKVFNEPQKAKKTWIYAIIASIVIFGGIFLIPNLQAIPNQIIPLFYTAIASLLVYHFQGENIKTHINAGGPIYNWWRVIGISLIGLAITIIPIIGFALLTDPSTFAETKTYGNLKHEIMFDSSSITEKEVDQLADGLTTTTFFDDFQQKSIFLKKENNKYILVIPVTENAWKEPEALAMFEQLRLDLQSLYPNNKISFDLCEDFDTIKKRVE